jgi:metallo-beta-lactamase family protein
MKITFHGAARTVTGSQHLIEVNGHRILLDCGFYQGKRSESRERNIHLPFDAASIDVMVLSHAHIDHSGNVPNLIKSGFKGDIICTSATRDLAASMLQDSGHIQEKDAEYLNKKLKKRGEPPVKPIYTQQDAETALRSFVGINYERAHVLAPGVVLTLVDAGHMLGSAMVILDIEDQEAKRDVRLVFSGDIGHPGMPILRSPSMIEEADIVIMESTYGGRFHPPMEETEHKFDQTIDATAARGGKIIIPAFAVGRTQQIIYSLNKLSNEHELPANLAVYVDSPLAVNVTDVFRMHPEAYSDLAREYLEKKDPDGDLFGFPKLHYVREVEDSKALNGLRTPAIIISASGMAEFGRILHHLKNNIEDPRNTILIVGWQAPDTLGRRLVEGATEVRIFGEEYHRRAQVVTLNGFSGHADHNGLVNWVKAFKKRRPEHIFLVHGEITAQEAIVASLKTDLGFKNVHIPDLHQSFTL